MPDAKTKHGTPLKKPSFLASVPPTPPVLLPDKPGFYLWYTLDWGYLGVGAVQVLADPEKHREYLQGEIARCGADKCDFHLYQSPDGTWLTMYHQAHDRKPFIFPNGVPNVDGYRAFDFNWLIP